MSFEQLIQIAINGGLPTALVLFFVWENRKREDDRNKRLESLETFQKEVLLSLVRDNSELQARSNVIILESTRTIELVLHRLERIDSAHPSG